MFSTCWNVEGRKYTRLEFVENQPMYIEEYADVLFEHYEQGMIDIYPEHIKSEALSLSNRKQYRKVCYKKNSK